MPEETPRLLFVDDFLVNLSRFTAARFDRRNGTETVHVYFGGMITPGRQGDLCFSGETAARFVQWAESNGTHLDGFPP